MELMNWNGGGANSSGTGISNIDTQGNVHPDQFWHELTLGNVKERKFSDIWSNRDNATLNALRNRKEHLTGKCAECSFLDVCGGGFRVRRVANDRRFVGTRSILLLECAGAKPSARCIKSHSEW
jgi:Fe-coproporphyrin III synthase